MHQAVDIPKKARILIVDDDNFVRTVFHDALHKQGYLTTVVADGDSALASLAKEPHDLVLLDLIMPGKDGFETCQELRLLKGGQHLPVLMVTASADTFSINRAYEAGATDFITKPVNPELLVHRVRYLLRAAQNLQKLELNTARLANAQRIAQLGNWDWDPDSDLFRCSEETRTIMGYEGQWEPVFLPEFLDMVEPGEREMVRAGLADVAGGSHSNCTMDFRLQRPDGNLRVVRLQAYRDEVDLHEMPRVTGTIQDLTEMQQAEDRMQMLKEAIDCLPLGTGVTISDVNGKIIYANSVEAEMHGYAPEELVGRDASILAPAGLEQPFPPGKLREIDLWRRESVNVRKNGEVFPVSLSSIAVRNRQGWPIGVVTACEDITSRKDSEKRIEYLAYYDTLTGLPNRVTLQDQLPRALSMARRDCRQMALLFLDLDNFKDVNDTQGHDFGDRFLKEVASRLTICVRGTDTLVRLGGDEFVVILSSIKDHEGASAAAQRILSVFATPFIIDGHQFYSSASIGIALYPDDGVDAESLLKCADAAMYHAKGVGRSNFQFFSSEMDKKIMRRVALENCMRQGIGGGEFAVHYHPQWSLNTGLMVGVEALLRWNNAEFGNVSASEFIPLAETTGLIFELGEMVLRAVLSQMQSWASQGHDDLKVAVNISGKQFSQPDFLDTISSIIKESGVAPSSIELEFTESVLMEKADRNIATLRALKGMGMRLSIDDFGTGYSSLNYLKHFPIDTIKIDRSFIADVNSKSDDAAIAEAIISMAHTLGLKVIAEGVENLEQLRFLRERNCDEVQGYYLAMPMPVEKLDAYLSKSHAKGVVTMRDWKGVNALKQICAGVQAAPDEDSGSLSNVCGSTVVTSS